MRVPRCLPWPATPKRVEGDGGRGSLGMRHVSDQTVFRLPFRENAHHERDLFPSLPARSRPDAQPQATDEGVRVEKAFGREFVVVEPSALRLLAEQAMIDIKHLLRPGHLAQLARIPAALRRR